MGMRLGFDLSQAAYTGGVGNYTLNLANSLSSIDELKIIFFYSSLRKPYRGDLKNVKSYKIPPSLSERLFNKFPRLAIEKFIGDIDVYHSSDWTQPKTKAKKVTTYHDLVPIIYPEWSHPKIVDVQRRRLRLVEKEVDMVIAVSESTKKDLLKVSAIPEEKIIVVYEGVSDKFKPLNQEQIAIFKKEKKLPDSFILAVKGIGERKNIKRVREAAKDYSLIILGEDIDVSISDLPFLYGSADLLLYPSLYEGFGLPVLEAMACGTPVITSNTSSLPEVGGEAALYVDPENVSDIRSKVNNLMNDEGLRKELVKRGVKQAAKFSWTKCASETYEVYKRMLNK